MRQRHYTKPLACNCLDVYSPKREAAGQRIVVSACLRRVWNRGVAEHDVLFSTDMVAGRHSNPHPQLQSREFKLRRLVGVSRCEAGHEPAAEIPSGASDLGARGGNRTRTTLSGLGILSPVRLPVSPPGRHADASTASTSIPSGSLPAQACPSVVHSSAPVG